MLRRISLAALLLTLAVPNPVVAETERRYDVELVLIENLDTSAGERERWRPRVTVPPVNDAIALSQSAAQTGAALARAERMAEAPEGFEPLPPEERRLGGAVQRLQESERYRVLRHLAWRQPALDDDQAVAVRAWQGAPITVRVPIRDFEELYALEEAAAEGEAGTRTAAEADERERTPDADREAGGARTFGTGPMSQTNVRPLLRPVAIHPLDGTVRVVVSRYLHVYTDLYFTTPVQWTALTRTGAESAAAEAEARARGSSGGITAPRVALGPDGRAMLSYPFVQHRRMRSGELHYLDHPVLGLLIRVDRASEDEADDTGAGEGESGGA